MKLALQCKEQPRKRNGHKSKCDMRLPLYVAVTAPLWSFASRGVMFLRTQEKLVCPLASQKIDLKGSDHGAQNTCCQLLPLLHHLLSPPSTPSLRSVSRSSCFLLVAESWGKAKTPGTQQQPFPRCHWPKPHPNNTERMKARKIGFTMLYWFWTFAPLFQVKLSYLLLCHGVATKVSFFLHGWLLVGTEGPPLSALPCCRLLRDCIFKGRAEENVSCFLLFLSLSVQRRKLLDHTGKGWIVPWHDHNTKMMLSGDE